MNFLLLITIKGDVRNAEGASSVSYLGTHDSSGSQTSSTLSSHEESTRASSRNVFTSRALSPSSWSDYIFKYLLVTSNLLFSVLGLVTLVVGLWGLINKESFAQEKIKHVSASVLLGRILLLVEAQVLVAVVLYSLQGQIAEYLRSGMLAAMVRYQDDLDLRFITDEIQTGLQCCGRGADIMMNFHVKSGLIVWPACCFCSYSDFSYNCPFSAFQYISFYHTIILILQSQLRLPIIDK
uniref:Tetraspanin 10 n=1 Tax=Sinocyclocheilus anshuiensis TaxID=1608454 RepID=A0A671T7F5_9TELE